MAVLSAGIRSLLRKAEGADLSRPAEGTNPGRDDPGHHPGIAGGFLPEPALLTMLLRLGRSSDASYLKAEEQGEPAIYRAAGIGCPTSFLRPPRIMRIDAGAFGETESASDLTGPTFSTSCALALDIAGLWSGN